MQTTVNGFPTASATILVLFIAPHLTHRRWISLARLWSKEDASLPPDYVSLAQLQERWIKKQQEKKLKEKQEVERKELDEVESKEDPSLPPDYVSLAQLQERWIKKQQEKKLKENQEAERKELKSRAQNDGNDQRGLESDAHKKMAGLSLNDGGKGKEIGTVGSENAEKKKKKRSGRKKKKKMMMNNRENEEKKSAADGQNRNGREGAEIVEEIEVKVGNEGILSGERSGNNGGLKGIEQIASVNMVEVLPAVEAMYLTGGFVRNRGNRSSQRNNNRKEHRVRVHHLEKKIENEKGCGKKWIERRRNDDSCYRLEENNRDDAFKSSELEPEAENKAEDGISEVCSETNRSKTKEECLNDDSVELEKKVDNGVLAIESVRNPGNVCRRYGNRRGRNGSSFSRLASNGWKSGKVRSNVGDMKRSESGMMWVKREKKSGGDAAEVSSYGVSEDQA